MPILRPFLEFPDQGAIIGRLLAGYALLEIDIMHCVSVVRDDLDTVLKAMFRPRGETQRIEIADAFGRQHYCNWNLGTQFSMSVGAMRHCLKIRNQYAHCIWHADGSGQLGFVNLEEIANRNDLIGDLKDLTVKYVDLPLLQQQEAYFDFTDQLIAWTSYEGRVRAGKLSTRGVPKPRQMKRPPLHLLP